MALKQQLIARLTGVNAVSAAQLARETGISQQNLSRWLSEARSSSLGAADDGMVSSWTVSQKARIIAGAAGLAGDQLTTYLQAAGVTLGYFRRWRLALEEAGEESLGLAKRIGRLERELARKERALAEAATRWVLRETVEGPLHKEDQLVDEQVEQAPELSDLLPAGASLMDTPTPSSVANHMRRQRVAYAKEPPSLDEPRSAELS